MLIYWKGINSADLEHIVEFIYNGETFIPQDKLTVLLELQVKGLQEELLGISEKVSENQNADQDEKIDVSNNDDDIIEQEGINDSLEEMEELCGAADTVFKKRSTLFHQIMIMN